MQKSAAHYLRWITLFLYLQYSQIPNVHISKKSNRPKNEKLPMKQEIYNTLDRLGIDYTRLEHPPIMTMEEGMTIAQKLGVSSCKNLFLVNKQKEYFLLLLSGNKKLSAKSIAKQIGSSHLSFASDEDMQTLLFTTPGAVSILGLIYDKENKFKWLIDKDVIQADYIGCHPCENTCSLKIRTKDILEVLLSAINHADFEEINTEL